MTSTKRKIIRLAFLALGLLLPLIAAEVFFRLSTPTPFQTIQKVDDPEMIYAHIPNFTGGSGDWEFKYNSIGLRGPEVGPKNPKRKRILFIGDSITDGRPKESKSYPAVVERILREKGIEAECLNAGVTGYNIGQIRAHLRMRLDQLQPDIVVYGLCLNDILPPGAVDEGGGLKSSPSLFTRIKQLQTVTRIGRAVQWYFISTGKKPPVGDYAPYCRRVMDMYQDAAARDTFLRELSRIESMARDSGAPLLVAIFPLSTQYMGDGDEAQDLIRKNLPNTSVLDLKSALARAGGSLSFVPNDPVHPLDPGHEEVGKDIAEIVSGRLLRP